MKRFRNLNILSFIKSKNFILFLIFLVLFLIPSLFWGNLYQVGGDDTRLYYLFPKEFLQNFVFNIVSNNSLGVNSGYSSVSFFAPQIIIIYLFKLVPYVNVQLVMYGLNLGLGFFFFYLLLGLWIESKGKYDFLIKIIASLFYIFSIYIIKTLYSYQLLSIYLVSTIPITLYLFIKGINTKRIQFILLSSLVFSAFSSTINSAPWLFGLFFSLLPLLLFIFWENKKIFIFYSLLFLISIFLLNFYWLNTFLLPHFVNLGGANITNYLNSSNFKNSTRDLINALSTLNSPLNQFFTYVRTSWSELEIFNYIYLPNLIFILIIIAAGLFVKIKSNKLGKIYLFLLFDLLLSFFLFTPNLGNWSVNLFILLNDKIPFFTAVKTMYDKFSFAMSFNYALVFAISLKIIFDKVSDTKIKNLLLAFIVLIIFINSKNFILPKFNDDSFSTRITNFNKDYYDLTSYIKNMHEASRFLWLPLTNASYVVIEDQNLLNHYYWGPSPLQILSQASDLTGFLSFPTVSNPSLSNLIEVSIDKKNNFRAISYLRRFGIKYIIINNTLDTKIRESRYLFSSSMYEKQMGGFKKEILGKKIRDFGSRYSLYSIIDKYKTDKLFTTDNINEFSDIEEVKYEKKQSYEYNIKISNLSGKKYLVFLDPYSKGWNIYLQNSSGVLLPFKNIISYRYGNSWLLDTDYIKRNFSKTSYEQNKDGSINFNLRLYFYPQKFTFFANLISILSVIINVFIISFYWVRQLVSAKK